MPKTVEFAKSADRVVLVDGIKLTDLMFDFEAGMTMRPARIDGQPDRTTPTPKRPIIWRVDVGIALDDV